MLAEVVLGGSPIYLAPAMVVCDHEKTICSPIGFGGSMLAAGLRFSALGDAGAAFLAAAAGAAEAGCALVRAFSMPFELVRSTKPLPGSHAEKRRGRAADGAGAAAAFGGLRAPPAFGAFAADAGGLARAAGASCPRPPRPA